MYKGILFLGILLALPFSAAFGQQEDDGYQQELSYGINFNTIGGLIGGGSIKLTTRLEDKWYQFLALEAVEIKHPKEQLTFNYSTGGSYVAGKHNYLFALRPQYGREYVFFKKAPENGVQVNGIIALGPTIGLEVPYMIDYNANQGNSNVDADVRREQYDPMRHTELNILGRAGVFNSLNQINPNIGGHFKSGISFEYGRYRESVAGVETGVMVESYLRKPVLMVMLDTQQRFQEAFNRQTFVSFYLTIYYGRRK